MKLLPEPKTLLDKTRSAKRSHSICYSGRVKMRSVKKNEKWLLVERSNGSCEVVNVRALLNSAESQLAIGSMVTMAVGDDENKSAKIIAAARDASKLQLLVNPPQAEDDKKQSETDNAAQEQQDGDFSGSDESSWAPSENSSSSEASHTEEKTPNVRQYFNKSGRVLTPCTRVNAIIPNFIPPKQKQDTNSNIKNSNQMHKGNKKETVKSEQNLNTTELETNVLNVNHQNGDTENELAIINNLFFKIFKLLSDNKAQNGTNNIVSKPSHDYQNINNSSVTDVNGNHNASRAVMSQSIKQDQSRNQSGIKDEESTMVEHTMSEDEYARSEDSNRSDDNVLISNKYATVDSPRVKDNNLGNISKISKHTKPGKSKTSDEEWIPIGSGQTLVYKDQFNKVNWKSYTMATRTLLLAVFPRHILATHSLTGKKSPAFQDKPPKMSLDQRIIQDVVIEITDRFNVKENLVRTIITTKCADECKMMKIKKEKMNSFAESKRKHKRTKTLAVKGKDLNHTS